MEPDLPEPARAFADGDVEIPPATLAPAEQAALVALLVARADGVRLERLAASPDKALAKQARRGLHLLRTRGASVPAPAPRHFRIEEGPYAQDSEPSLATAFDASGERMIFLVRPAPDGAGLHVFQARLSDERGLVEFAAGAMTRKQWRAHERGILDEPGVVAARVPGAHARWLVEAAWQQSIAAERPAPPGFGEARLELGPAVRPERHPALLLAPPLPADEARARLASLHALDAIAPWEPPAEFLAELDLELGQISTSRLIVDPTARTEQLDRALERLAERALLGPLRARLVERLLETALLFARLGRDADARLCSAAAELTADAAFAPNPFVVALFGKLVDREKLLRPPDEPRP